jgi:hypothetical protein
LGSGLCRCRRRRPLKNLSNLSLTTLLRNFEQGVFSSAAALGALIAIGALTIIAGICLDTRRTLARKLIRSVLVGLVAAGMAASIGFRPLYADATENRRNSFPLADAATLARLDKPLSVVVRLAPEDPRYIDFRAEHPIKLRRSIRHFTVTLNPTRGQALRSLRGMGRSSIAMTANGRKPLHRREVLPLITV